VVGRSAELDLLAAAVEGAAAGAGGIVFLSGEPGMGKTRVAAEAVELARSSGMAVLSGRATPSPTPPPYRPLAEAFGSAWRGRGPPAGPAQEGLRPALEILVPAWATPGDGRRTVASTVTIGEAALVLLDGLGGAGALLVVDDLQWSDPESLEVLEYLADTVPERPVLVVVTVRTGEGPGAERLAHTLTARRSAQLVTLGPLDGPGVRAAVAAALGTTDPPPALVTALGERSGGSPFLVEELLASLIGVGALAHTGAGWEVRGALPVVVPESFTLAVADRLAALPAPARGVVEMAAVLGERFDWRLVADAVPADVVVALRQAEESRLVEEDSGSGDFRFRHALTRTAVLGILVAPERVQLAGRALAAMGALDMTTDPERLGLAAQLAETAGDGDRAFALRLTSSRAALRVGAVASAREAASDALRLARTPERVVDARRALLDAGVAAADTTRITPLGRQLLDQLAALGAPDEDVAEIHQLLAAAAVNRSDWCQATAGLDAAARCAPTPPAAVSARHEALRAEVALGEHRIDAALAHAHGARTAAVRAGRRDLEADALALLGRASRLSDLDAAERWFVAAVGTAELSGSALRLANALHELATIDVIGIGRTDRVLHARRIAAEIGAPGRVAATDLQLAVLHWKRHELDDARAAAHRAVTAGQRFGLGLLVPLAHIIGGVVDAASGYRDRAVAAFDRARPTMDDEIEASGRGNLLALAALAVEDRAGALDELARAVALAPPDSASAHSPYRGLHALLLAIEDAPGAEDAAADLAATPVVDAVARHYGTLARAVLAGRSGDAGSAEMHFSTADTELTGAPWLRNLGRRLVAEAAVTDGWGDPSTWLHDAHAFFSGTAPELARACRSLLRHSGSPLPRVNPDEVPPPLAARGITLRETDVLVLLARGLSNREIAARLRLSPRTVEKHVERLMGKTGTTRRTQLVALMAGLSRAR
jgi:DNA-binding CsgD family transcriptional regulator/tetratricopeptide (TPR) repeat protein